MAIIVMYGIDMSSAGIERIYGPIEGAESEVYRNYAAGGDREPG